MRNDVPPEVRCGGVAVQEEDGPVAGRGVRRVQVAHVGVEDGGLLAAVKHGLGGHPAGQRRRRPEEEMPPEDVDAVEGCHGDPDTCEGLAVVL